MPDTKERHEKFDRLYQEFYRYSYKIAFRIIRDPNQMEDILQEVWANIWRTIDIINDKDSAKAWISTLARNTAKNLSDKNLVRDKRVLNIDDDALYAAIPECTDDPIDIVASKDNIEYIYRQMQSLDKKYADVLLLKHKFRCAPNEIANFLHINPKTVYTRLSRGEKMLKENLLNAEGSEMK